MSSIDGALTLGPTAMTKCTGGSRISAHDKVIWGNNWYSKEDGKTNFKNASSWVVLWRPSLLSEGSRLLKKLDLQRTPLAKRCRHVGNHVIFPSILENSPPEKSSAVVLKPHRWRTHFLANHVSSICLTFLTGALLRHSLKPRPSFQLETLNPKP